MKQFHKQGSKNGIQELRPIKMELGGLTISNLFSKQTLFSDLELDDDQNDESQEILAMERLNYTNKDNEVEEEESEIFQQRKVNFEPDPEDDNHIDNNSNLFHKKRTIFETDPDEVSIDLGQGLQQQNALFQVIEDSRFTRYLFQKWQLIQVSSTIFSIISIFLAIIEFDIEAQHMEVDEQTKDFILVTISICTFILSNLLLTQIKRMVIIAYDYRIDLQLKKAQKIMTKNETVWSTNAAYYLILEILILIPHPNFITKGITVETQQAVDDFMVKQQVNDFFGIWILIRIYVLIRTILSHSIYSSTRAKRICRMIGCDSGSFYSIKCIFTEIPLTATTFLVVICVLIYGHALRVSEKNLYDYYGQTQNFGNYMNCFWCILITMATVGYGDYYPKTLCGRIVIIFTSITEVVLISILVVALTVSLNMNIAEKKTHHVIKRLRARKNLIDNAAMVLTKAAKFKAMVKKSQIENKSIQKGKLNDVKKDINKFRVLNRRVKNMYDNSNQSEEMFRQFDFLKSEMKQIYENQNKLREYLLKIKTNINKTDFEERTHFTMSEYAEKESQ